MDSSRMMSVEVVSNQILSKLIVASQNPTHNSTTLVSMARYCLRMTRGSACGRATNSNSKKVDMATRTKLTPDQIEKIYDSGENRVTQERNDFLLPQILNLVREERWLNIRPEYQRRLVRLSDCSCWSFRAASTKTSARCSSAHRQINYGLRPTEPGD